MQPIHKHADTVAVSASCMIFKMFSYQLIMCLYWWDIGIEGYLTIWGH